MVSCRLATACLNSRASAKIASLPLRPDVIFKTSRYRGVAPGRCVRLAPVKRPAVELQLFHLIVGEAATAESPVLLAKVVQELGKRRAVIGESPELLPHCGPCLLGGHIDPLHPWAICGCKSTTCNSRQLPRRGPRAIGSKH